MKPNFSLLTLFWLLVLTVGFAYCNDTSEATSQKTSTSSHDEVEEQKELVTTSDDSLENEKEAIGEPIGGNKQPRDVNNADAVIVEAVAEAITSDNDVHDEKQEQPQPRRKTFLVLLDLGRESTCNNVSNDLPEEAAEIAGQKAEAVQWAASKLDMSNSQIRIVDTCGNLGLTVSRILALASEYDLIERLDSSSESVNKTSKREISSASSTCQLPKGFLLLASQLGPEAAASVTSVLPSLNLYRPPRAERLEEQASVLAMAKRLKWKQGILLGDDLETLKDLGKAASREDICIVDHVLFNTNRTNDLAVSNQHYISIRERLERSGVKNILALSRNRRAIELARTIGINDFEADVSSEEVGEAEAETELDSTNARGQSQEDLRWIFALPKKTDGGLGFAKTDAQTKTSPIYTMEPHFSRVPEFMDFYRNLSAHANKTAEDPGLMPFLRLFVGLQTLVVVEDKKAFKRGCPDLDLPSVNMVRKKLGLSEDPRQFKAKLQQISSENNSESEVIGEFTPDRGLELEDAYENVALPGQNLLDDEDEVTCLHSDCRCLNMEVTPPEAGLRWRMQPWVTIMVTVACLGIAASIGFGLYMMCRSCTEVLDASQSFSLLLVLAVILTYTSLLPYSLGAMEIVCWARSAATRLSFALLFSVMLSRSLMLATADVDGLPGHISGFIQFSLLVFMMSVQIGLVVQEWFLRSEPYTSLILVGGRHQRLQCVDRGHELLISLGYVMLLLILQLLISPCIVRSRRNYKEGLLFTCGSFSCLLVWVGWTAAYLMFGETSAEWHDIAVCCGLVASATVLNLVVFIPKCYLMTASSPSSLYKGHSEVNLQGLMAASTTSVDHVRSVSGAGVSNEMLSRSVSSRLSHVIDDPNRQHLHQPYGLSNNGGQAASSSTTTDDTTLLGGAGGRGHHGDLAMNNALAALGSKGFNSNSMYDSLKESVRYRKPNSSTSYHPEGATSDLEEHHARPYRSRLSFAGKTATSDNTMPQFMASGSAFDSPTASEYPTFKLDQNTVVDNSIISWERYNYNPDQLTTASASISSRPRGQQQPQPQTVGIPNPPPNPSHHQNRLGGSGGTTASRNLVV